MGKYSHIPRRDRKSVLAFISNACTAHMHPHADTDRLSSFSFPPPLEGEGQGGGYA